MHGGVVLICSLPTLENLAKRKVVLSDNCLSCNRELETVAHALLGCENLKVAWGTNFDELRNVTNHFFSFVAFQVSDAESLRS